jgi:hypothetical protein
MTSQALTKTRIALGMLMVTATLATTGVAGSLALARSQTTARDTAGNTAGAAGTPASTPTSRSTHHRPASAGPTFAPTSRATTAPAPSHTKTKGS